MNHQIFKKKKNLWYPIVEPGKTEINNDYLMMSVFVAIS